MNARSFLRLALSLTLAGCGDDVAPQDAATDAPATDAPALDVADASPRDASPSDAAVSDATPADAPEAPLACAPLTNAATLETGFARGVWSATLTDNVVTNVYDLAAGGGGVWAAAALGQSASFAGTSVTVADGQSAVVVARYTTAGATPRTQTISVAGASPDVVRLAARADGATVYVRSAFALHVGTLTLMPPANTPALWAIQLDASGAPVSARSFATPPDSVVQRFQPAADGGYVMALMTPTAATIDGARFDCDAVIVRAAPDGSTRWKRCIAPARGTVPDVHGLSIAPDGAVYVSGFPIREPDFGFGRDAFDASGGGSFVLRVEPDGRSGWVRHVQRIYADVFATSDGVLLFGNQLEALAEFPYRFGDRPLTTCSALNQAFLGRLDARGAPQWYRDLGANVAQVAGVASNGDVLLTLLPHRVRTSLSLGAATFPQDTAAALARVSADGRVLRSQSVAGVSAMSMQPAAATFDRLVPEVDGRAVGLFHAAQGSFSFGARGTVASGAFGSLALVGVDL